jgi:hypothetical protein
VRELVCIEQIVITSVLWNEKRCRNRISKPDLRERVDYRANHLFPAPNAGFLEGVGEGEMKKFLLERRARERDE